MAIGLVAWTFLGFMLAQAIVIAIVTVITLIGGENALAGANQAVLNISLSAAIYVLSLLIIIGVPWLIKKRSTTKEELGVQRPPVWMDFVWAPTGLVVYFILSAILVTVAMYVLTFVDFSQAQDTGFSGISNGYEYVLAFIGLVILAPVAEEVVFRGYLFGKLRKYTKLWVAILLTSLLFAVVHFAWNVGIDVFALSIVLCLLRVISKSLWPSIMLHMMKNGIAFYFLFINPTLLSTLGG